MNTLFDPRQVRRAFSRASAGYASAAKLQAEIETRLLESLDYYAEGREGDARTPSLVVDLGCGPGRATRAIQQRWPKAKVLALDRADQRLASLLVNLAERSGVKEPNGIRVSVRLTRQDMANMVGVTTETAIRIMARFKKERLVSGTAARLIIRDLPKLRILAST